MLHAPSTPSPQPAGAPGAPSRLLPLRLEGVSYQVGGRTLIRDVHCELRAGIRTVLLGPNGAGKSLLLRLCHGLLRPTAGRIVWNGEPAERGAQAMVFQRPVMLRRSALANVEYALALKGLSRRERRRTALQFLERTGLARLAARSARVLSVGEQQRLAVARAWALEPEVLFLDEPTASLDPAASAAVEELISAIFAAGTKIVMTTHDLGQARRLSDEVLFIHQGRLLEVTPSEAFFARPQSREARAYLRGDLVW
ncbi:MAG: ATP-binding cassette domain-containing protein [bacterium]